MRRTGEHNLAICMPYYARIVEKHNAVLVIHETDEYNFSKSEGFSLAAVVSLIAHILMFGDLTGFQPRGDRCRSHHFQVIF